MARGPRSIRGKTRAAHRLALNVVLLAGLGLAHSGPALGARPDNPRQDAGDRRRLCAAVVAAFSCDWELEGVAVQRLCPAVCAHGEPSAPEGGSGADGSRVVQRQRAARPRQLAENATGPGPRLCVVTDDGVEIESCFAGEQEAYPGQHADRQTAVNEAMAATAVAPLSIGVSLFLTFCLTCCSAFCSGLTLGLMGLDMTMLGVVMQSGTDKDKARARKIEPIRKTGNQLLCMLLIGNTAVNAGLAITMASLTSGFWGFITSTCLILVFGEITPQAICCRHGLAIGAALFWPIQLCMWVFYPLAYPIALLLNLVLGKEIGLSYSREELIALLALHAQSGQTECGPQGDLNDMEAQILTGVLRFTEKTAQDVFTPLKYVQAVGLHESLDLSTLNCVYRSGHSRIPVYDGALANLVGLIYVKDLIILDPEDSVPVAKVVEYFDHALPRVSGEMGLLQLLDEFVEGHAHMAVVCGATLAQLPGTKSQRQSAKTFEVADEDLPDAVSVDTNPLTAEESAALGIVTLEDLFEEMLALEIHDEHDVRLADMDMETKINTRSKAHIHEIPPRWLTHYGFDELTEEDYAASFSLHSLGDLASKQQQATDA